MDPWDFPLVSRARRSRDLSGIALLYNNRNVSSYLVMIIEIW